jgi:ATP-dependent helicase/nuclease subunit B
MVQRVFTIPPSVPFLPTLIGALRDGRLGVAPLADADATIFLPTRRACRLAATAFLDAGGIDAAVLPRIVPIGDIDEDELIFAEAATGDVAAAALDLPPTLDGLARRFLLARLVLAWAKGLKPLTGEPPIVLQHPASALALADDLARLMDDMTTREVSWDRLDDLVPDRFDDYWRLTLRFLAIAHEQWPQILAAHDAIEPAERRDRMIAAEAARLDGKGLPVIAAGSTGSMPATAKLLATVASLPNGAVVLPGLDTELDEASWKAIGDAPGHPQFAMHGLLARIGIARSEVATLAAPADHGREIFVSEALRPAAATDLWRTRLLEDRFGRAVERGLADLTVIEAANAEEEALAVAVVLREALEEPGRTAALVTPDRALARRVGVALRRWNIVADDSGGDPLADTAAGVFARAVADAALGGLEPAPLLALLKHKFARFGTDEMRHASAVAALERAILRGARPRPGSAGLAHALTSFAEQLTKLRRGEPSEIHPAEPRAVLRAADVEEAQALVARIAAALKPLEQAVRSGEFIDLAARHREAVARASEHAGDVLAFAGPDGKALAMAFDDIAAQVGPDPFAVPTEDYPELFRAAIDGRVVRRPGLPESRVRILGPLEARLTSADRVVIGGLVEGVWPGEAHADAWLSRPMRRDIGLDLPERRIGLAAHDFAQLLGAREVFLTYASRLAGAPTVASRFVQRLAAVAGAPAWAKVIARGERYGRLARSLDAPKATPKPCARPEPRPPRAARPKSLSVTEIEHWLRDPYTIYAKHILKLPRLAVVDEPPGAAERGTVIHGAIGDFASLYADALPADPYAELIRLGRARFADLDDYPEVRAFWWPRYERIARWFADFERKRRPAIAAAHAEIRGELKIPVGGEIFRLTGRADRIEARAAGGYAILDFKTGTPPTDPQVASGLAPQLTLEAAMLRNGAFPGIAAGSSVAELVYVRLSGGEPPGEDRVVDVKKPPDAAADQALAKLTTLIARFDNNEQAYHPLMLSMWAKRYGTYDDLARVKEWSAGTDEEVVP